MHFHWLTFQKFQPQHLFSQQMTRPLEIISPIMNIARYNCCKTSRRIFSLQSMYCWETRNFKWIFKLNSDMIRCQKHTDNGWKWTLLVFLDTAEREIASQWLFFLSQICFVMGWVLCLIYEPAVHFFVQEIPFIPLLLLSWYLLRRL